MDKVEFLAVYIREAHAADGWVLESNPRASIVVPQHTNQNERLAASQKFCEMLKPSYPLLVDEFDDHVTQAYSATPNRLYIIDRDGKVAYKSGRGPRGYRMGELEQSLVLHLLDQESAATHVAVGAELLGGEELVWSALRDLEACTLKEQEKALLRFAGKVTKNLPSITEADVESLRAVGWTDEGIYYTITVCALFNFYNRWIDASGVHAMSEEAHRQNAKRSAAGGYVRK